MPPVCCTAVLPTLRPLTSCHDHEPAPMKALQPRREGDLFQVTQGSDPTAGISYTLPRPPAECSLLILYRI